MVHVDALVVLRCKVLTARDCMLIVSMVRNANAAKRRERHGGRCCFTPNSRCWCRVHGTSDEPGGGQHEHSCPLDCQLRSCAAAEWGYSSTEMKKGHRQLLFGCLVVVCVVVWLERLWRFCTNGGLGDGGGGWLVELEGGMGWVGVGGWGCGCVVVVASCGKC